MDLQTLLKSFINSIHSVTEYNILGLSIFIWLALFIGLFLVFAMIEKEILKKTEL